MSEDDRVSASDLVDYALYWYAIVHFFVVTALLPDVFSADRGVAYTYFIAISLFLFVLVRNYLVMHAIDSAAHRQDSTFEFLKGNSGATEFFERFFRFLIMLTVIVTPKGAYPWAMWVVSHVEILGTHLIEGAAGALHLDFAQQFAPASFMHDALPYYAAVLLILFLEFLFWDITNVLALSRRMAELGVSLDIDLDRGLVPHAEYRAMLRYFNACRSRSSTVSRESVVFEARYFEHSYPKAIQNSSVWYLYLTSSKLLERLFGIASAIAILTVSRYEFSMPTVALCTFVIVLYGSQAVRNERYWKSMIGHIKFPISYFRSGMNPFS